MLYNFGLVSLHFDLHNFSLPYAAFPICAIIRQDYLPCWKDLHSVYMCLALKGGGAIFILFFYLIIQCQSLLQRVQITSHYETPSFPRDWQQNGNAQLPFSSQMIPQPQTPYKLYTALVPFVHPPHFSKSVCFC